VIFIKIFYLILCNAIVLFARKHIRNIINLLIINFTKILLIIKLKFKMESKRERKNIFKAFL